MKSVYGYVRVSTVKQGMHGVSLQEQRDAIERYARANNLHIEEWFVEQQTAAKSGRPIFSKMLKLLKAGKASGVVIHKIDRSARNLRDWAALGEMIDNGIVVHFANESLDMHSRGGRLSADIQAVIAADFIRNLREETRKGFYGRLKQGLYPLPAPLGYVDKGKGKPKEIDKVKAPLIRKAFELYATGSYNLERLEKELAALGLRNRNGGRVTRNGLSTILNNPFYMGLIRLHKTGEVFQGNHCPIVTKELFDRVNAVLTGKVNQRRNGHDYLYRRTLRCSGCNKSLIGEYQKGRVYYRCHTPNCPTASVRSDYVYKKIVHITALLQLSNSELLEIEKSIEEYRQDERQSQSKLIKSLRLQLANLDKRLDRLTDAYLNQDIEKDIFDRKKAAILYEYRQLSESLQKVESGNLSVSDEMQKIIEQLRTVKQSYISGNTYQKREILNKLTSNCEVFRRELTISLNSPFDELAKRRRKQTSDLYQYTTRTNMVKESSADSPFGIIYRYIQQKNNIEN